MRTATGESVQLSFAKKLCPRVLPLIIDRVVLTRAVVLVMWGSPPGGADGPERGLLDVMPEVDRPPTTMGPESRAEEGGGKDAGQPL